MPSPFLSIITRVYKRPLMLAINKQSLASQTCQDYEQIYIVDNVGRGLHWANKALASARPRGEYVLILDDDDMFSSPLAIETLFEATYSEPDVVVFRADHGKLGILPSSAVYHRKEPIQARIGSCDFIVKRDLWRRHIAAFGAPECGDYHFLASIWTEEPRVVWLYDILTAVQRISKGKPETATEAVAA